MIEDIFTEGPVWPFKSMEVGQVVTFSENQARAQATVHAYGRTSEPRMKFKTKTDKATGILYIKRIA